MILYLRTAVVAKSRRPVWRETAAASGAHVGGHVFSGLYWTMPDAIPAVVAVALLLDPPTTGVARLRSRSCVRPGRGARDWPKTVWRVARWSAKRDGVAHLKTAATGRVPPTTLVGTALVVVVPHGHCRVQKSKSTESLRHSTCRRLWNYFPRHGGATVRERSSHYEWASRGHMFWLPLHDDHECEAR